MRMDFPDDRLRLIFTCCHPALNREAQVALTLRTLGGLTTPEIARAFLLPRRRWRSGWCAPNEKSRRPASRTTCPAERLPERLAAVQAVIYLIFNEGYAASSGDALVRGDLCAEAIRLGRHAVRTAARARRRTPGLLALMLLQRFAARGAQGRGRLLVTLEEQDRSLWDGARLPKGWRWWNARCALAGRGPISCRRRSPRCTPRRATRRRPIGRRLPALYARSAGAESFARGGAQPRGRGGHERGPEEGLQRMAALSGSWTDIICSTRRAPTFCAA